MLRKLFPPSSLVASGLPAFQRQETIFVILDLSLLSILLLCHALFSAFWGNPSTLLVSVIGIGFSLRSAEFIWMYSLSELPSRTTIARLTWISILFDFLLALTLSLLTDSDDSPYYLLLVVPVLLAAFRFGAAKLACIISLASAGVFFPVWVYFRHHPPTEILEFLEAGVSSVLLGIVGAVVWMLVRDLRKREEEAEHNLVTLYQTREKLMEDEKLVALGSLSAGIAGEILNPACQIWASLAQAQHSPTPERDQILQTAENEARRLVALATDFLFYARLDAASATVISLPTMASDVLESCRSLANEFGVTLQFHPSGEFFVHSDPTLLKQAMLKLLQNAIEASAKGNVIDVRIYSQNQSVCFEVQNSGAPIPEPDQSRIFEPFFTTKSRGTGMGLSIARKIARIHGGDLELVSNEPRNVRFLLTIPEIEAPRDYVQRGVAVHTSS